MKQIIRPNKITLFVLFLLVLASVAQAAVVVSPSSVQVKPGGQVQFSATGATIVVWNLSGAGCVGITCGEIDSSGFYTAPATAPSPSVVTVTAVSIFDATQMGSATVTIGSSSVVSVALSPTNATVPVNGKQQFTATVSGSSNTAVNWTVSGIGCVGSSCGTVTSSGLYTAPATVPSPALATVTATSVADSTKSASANITITAASSVSVSVSPSTAQVATGKQQQFTASVTGTTNTAVTWSLSGCTSGCGSISSSGVYTAPSTVPSPATFKVVATSVASTSASGSAQVTVVSGSALTISPSSPQIKPGGQIQFSANGQSGVVVWSVTGSGCAGITCGSITSTGLYTAPATAPSPDTVTVTALLLSNTSISGSTTVTISTGTQVGVSVSPNSAQLNVGAKQQFTASVTGSSNTAVTWSVTGIGCSGTVCGSITTAGLYTAPSTVPTPSIVSVTATSVADPTKSASATITLVVQTQVTVSPAAVSVTENNTQQFTATVTGTANTGVTWTLQGAGCSGSSCGTITSSGLYTAPPSVPSPATVTVIATSVADGTTTGKATVTVIVPVVVTISPMTAIVAVSTTQQFRSSITGSSNTAVTWSVSGSGCSGSTCGTVSTSGLYTAPATLPSPATVTVKATSQANTASSATATVSLVATNNSKLEGQYAFYFTGFDSNGVYEAAGSFTADGKGTFKGTEDVNNVAAPSTDLAITGTYTVNSDNRGTMTIDSPLGAFTYKFALNVKGNKGRFVSFDQTGVRGSGVLELQDPTAFDPSALVNGYVMALSGTDMGGARVGALGLIFPDGVGFLAGSTMDVNDGGSVSPTFASFFGDYTVDSTGRGTATLVIPGLGGGTFDFVFYVVSVNELLMVSVDPMSQNGFIFGGPAVLQNGTFFTPASFNGGSIFSLSGTNGSTPDDMVGRFQFDGNNSVGVTFDENKGGKITVTNTMTGAYDMELNGRGTLNLNTSAGSLIWYIYATGPNQAFVLDASTAAVRLGESDAVQIIPPFSNSDALGSYLLGAGEPIVQTAPLNSGVSSFDGSSSVQGQGNVSGAEDISRSTSLSPNLTLTGTYSISPISNNGRGNILLTAPSAATLALWAISPSEMVGLDIDASVTQPTIMHFEQ